MNIGFYILGAGVSIMGISLLLGAVWKYFNITDELSGKTQNRQIKQLRHSTRVTAKLDSLNTSEIYSTLNSISAQDTGDVVGGDISPESYLSSNKSRVGFEEASILNVNDSVNNNALNATLDSEPVYRTRNAGIFEGLDGAEPHGSVNELPTLGRDTEITAVNYVESSTKGDSSLKDEDFSLDFDFDDDEDTGPLGNEPPEQVGDTGGVDGSSYGSATGFLNEEDLEQEFEYVDKVSTPTYSNILMEEEATGLLDMHDDGYRVVECLTSLR